MKNVLRCLLVFMIVGCGPSSFITNSWKAESPPGSKYKKIVVLGLIRDADQSLRQKMEQHIVNDLEELGYDAVCSCDEYNFEAFDGMDEQRALAKLKDAGVDGVLTVVLLDKTKEKQYAARQSRNYSDRFWGYYSTMRDRINNEGYYVVDTKYFWESKFYNMEKNELLYSAQSQTFDPSSSERLAHEYGQMIVKDMVKNNVLFNQKETRLKPM
jgi:hypothetical protein